MYNGMKEITLQNKAKTKKEKTLIERETRPDHIQKELSRIICSNQIIIN